MTEQRKKLDDALKKESELVEEVQGKQVDASTKSLEASKAIQELEKQEVEAAKTMKTEAETMETKINDSKEKMAADSEYLHKKVMEEVKKTIATFGKGGGGGGGDSAAQMTASKAVKRAAVDRPLVHDSDTVKDAANGEEVDENSTPEVSSELHELRNALKDIDNAGDHGSLQGVGNGS